MLEEEAEKRKIANLKQNKADVELVPHRSIGHSRDIAGEYKALRDYDARNPQNEAYQRIAKEVSLWQ
jgi:hypothetical protein